MDGFTSYMGRVYGTADMRSPIYYDLDNTAYYVDPNGTARLSYVVANAGIRIDGNENLYLDNNYGQSIVGVYTSIRYQGVFAMGNAYKLPIDGNGTGNLYGLAWSHPNAGGVASNLNTHGLLAMENGTWLASLTGSTRARDDMRAPIFYDNNDTGYYVNPNGTSRIGGIQINGANASSNELRFYGVSGDEPGSYNHTAIIERLWGTADQSELLLFKGNDVDSSTIHDRIRFGSTGRIVFQSMAGTYNVDSYISATGTGNIEGSGYFYGSEFHVPGSIWTPLVYDRNNSGYFVDPAGRSRLSSMDYGNGSYYLAGGSWGYRHNTPYGYIEFGPANSGHAHIYTDRSNFYFNVNEMYLNGNRVAMYNYWVGNIYLGTAGNFYATIFYDTNNSGYYCDPDGTNRLNFVNSNNHYIQPGYMLYSDPGGWQGEYNKIQWHSSHMYFQHQLSGYFIFRTDSGAERAYINRSGDLYLGYLGWLSNNLNQNVRTDAGPTFAQVYVNGWYRQNSSNGFYWQPYDRGFFSPEGGGNSYGHITTYGGGRSGWYGYGIASTHCLMSTTGDNVGVHDNRYSWIWYWDGSAFNHYRGYTYSVGSMRSPIFYDSDNTYWQMDPSGLVRVNYIYTYVIYDNDDSSFFADFNNWSRYRRLNCHYTPMAEMYHFATVAEDSAYLGIGWSTGNSGSNGPFLNSIRGFGDYWVRNNYNNCGQVYEWFNNYTQTMSLENGGHLRTRGAQWEWNGFSDRDLKTNLNVIENALEKIAQISGYTYEFAENTPMTNNPMHDIDGPENYSAGLIAQEVEAVLPTIVRDQWVDQGPDTVGRYYKSLNYNGIHGLTVQGIKELEAKSNALEERIAFLESKLEQIEGRIQNLENL